MPFVASLAFHAPPDSRLHGGGAAEWIDLWGVACFGAADPA